MTCVVLLMTLFLVFIPISRVSGFSFNLQSVTEGRLVLILQVNNTKTNFQLKSLIKNTQVSHTLSVVVNTVPFTESLHLRIWGRNWTTECPSRGPLHTCPLKLVGTHKSKISTRLFNGVRSHRSLLSLNKEIRL